MHGPLPHFLGKLLEILLPIDVTTQDYIVHPLKSVYQADKIKHPLPYPPYKLIDLVE